MSAPLATAQGVAQGVTGMAFPPENGEERMGGDWLKATLGFMPFAHAAWEGGPQVVVTWSYGFGATLMPLPIGTARKLQALLGDAIAQAEQLR